jgi:hypothetical protein
VGIKNWMARRMSEREKRYFAIIVPEDRIWLAAYAREGKTLACGKFVGYTLDYYSEEKLEYEGEFGAAIVGDFATKVEAENAIKAALTDYLKGTKIAGKTKS